MRGLLCPGQPLSAPCRESRADCADLAALFQGVPGSGVQGYRCAAFPDDSVPLDRIITALIQAAVMLPVGVVIHRLFELATDPRVPQRWLHWAGWRRALLGRTHWRFLDPSAPVAKWRRELARAPPGAAALAFRLVAFVAGEVSDALLCGWGGFRGGGDDFDGKKRPAFGRASVGGGDATRARPSGAYRRPSAPVPSGARKIQGVRSFDGSAASEAPSFARTVSLPPLDLSGLQQAQPPPSQQQQAQQQRRRLSASIDGHLNLGSLPRLTSIEERGPPRRSSADRRLKTVLADLELEASSPQAQQQPQEEEEGPSPAVAASGGGEWTAITDTDLAGMAFRSDAAAEGEQPASLAAPAAAGDSSSSTPRGGDESAASTLDAPSATAAAAGNAGEERPAPTTAKAVAFTAETASSEAAAGGSAGPALGGATPKSTPRVPGDAGLDSHPVPPISPGRALRVLRPMRKATDLFGSLSQLLLVESLREPAQLSARDAQMSARDAQRSAREMRRKILADWSSSSSSDSEDDGGAAKAKAGTSAGVGGGAQGATSSAGGRPSRKPGVRYSTLFPDESSSSSDGGGDNDGAADASGARESAAAAEPQQQEDAAASSSSSLQQGGRSQLLATADDAVAVEVDAADVTLALDAEEAPEPAAAEPAAEVPEEKEQAAAPPPAEAAPAVEAGVTASASDEANKQPQQRRRSTEERRKSGASDSIKGSSKPKKASGKHAVPAAAAAAETKRLGKSASEDPVKQPPQGAALGPKKESGRVSAVSAVSALPRSLTASASSDRAGASRRPASFVALSRASSASSARGDASSPWHAQGPRSRSIALGGAGSGAQRASSGARKVSGARLAPTLSGARGASSSSALGAELSGVSGFTARSGRRKAPRAETADAKDKDAAKAADRRRLARDLAAARSRRACVVGAVCLVYAAWAALVYFIIAYGYLVASQLGADAAKSFTSNWVVVRTLCRFGLSRSHTLLHHCCVFRWCSAQGVAFHLVSSVLPPSPSRRASPSTAERSSGPRRRASSRLCSSSSCWTPWASSPSTPGSRPTWTCSACRRR